jgi:hypothetical protein
LKENIKDLRGRIRVNVIKKGTKTKQRVTKKDDIYYCLLFGSNDTRRLRNFIYSTPSNLKMIRKWEKMQKAGTINIALFERKFRSFEDARRFVRKLGLKSWGEWERYCASGQRPEDIPFYPKRTYITEYKDAKDWLGVSRWSFKKARGFVRALGLKTEQEWCQYCKSGKKPQQIPREARDTYKQEWRGMKDWLGTSWWSFDKAKKFARTLCLRTATEWYEYCKNNKKPEHVPTYVYDIYKSQWTNWNDFLGIKSQ